MSRAGIRDVLIANEVVGREKISLQLEELVRVCDEEKRYEFMVVAAPLRLPGGTGSLFNPLALF